MHHEHEVKIPESVKEKSNRAKHYLRENKNTYLVGAGCLVIGYFLRKTSPKTVIINEIKPNITPLFIVDELPRN